MDDHAGADLRIEEIWREHRPYLVDLAFRMLGRIHDAEDVVQEAFTRLMRVDVDQIEEIRGWLVVVVSRLCLDQLRSARSRRETQVEVVDDTRAGGRTDVGGDPADRITLDDSVSMALLVVLAKLTPPERAVFVLHDVFQFSFETVAGIVGRTPAACRQLASRARRHLESETAPERFQPDGNEHHEVVERFIAACAGGDLESLMHVLDPEVVGDVDLGPLGQVRSVFHGNWRVARGVLTFFGPATGATLVSQPVNGRAGALGFRNGKLAGILVFEVRDDVIYDIHAIADPRKLAYAAHQLTS